jgi:hypothetical protein
VFEQMFDATRVAVTSTPTSARVDPGSTDTQAGPANGCSGGGAMRQYDDPVEVRRGEAEDPDQFLWRGRLWKVRAVLAHWVETSPWWQSTGARTVIGTEDAVGADQESSPPARPSLGDLLTERELWRVEAGRGRPRTYDVDGDPDGEPEPVVSGVFELSFDWADGRWLLVGCSD